MSYTQLTHEERYQIAVLLKAGLNQTEIAMILERHKSTLSQKIARSVVIALNRLNAWLRNVAIKKFVLVSAKPSGMTSES